MPSLLPYLAGLVLIVVSSSIVIQAAPRHNQSAAQPPRVMSSEEARHHRQVMSNMTQEQRNAYRDEQYQIIRQHALRIGYIMPEIPPWHKQPSAKKPEQPSEIELADEKHRQQLASYRKNADEKRRAMQERLEKQKRSIQKRIERLIQKNRIPQADENRPPRNRPLYRARPPYPPQYRYPQPAQVPVYQAPYRY